MNKKKDAEIIPDDLLQIGFPEKMDYVISGPTALNAINQAVEDIHNFRNDRLCFFKTVVGALAPESLRKIFEKLFLDRLSISYPSLINFSGSLLSTLVLFGLQERIGSVKENQRLVILPFMEYKLREKIKSLETEKPFGWRISKKFYKKNLEAISPLVDNLVHLIALAWTFCPGIGEPDKETGFYNRFAFTSNGGFIDLGHFFNCAVVSYLYGPDDATRRGDGTEIGQRWLREKDLLVKMRERRILDLVTNMLWGYATSADTIEDRASDKFGIFLGHAMREFKANGELIEYFVDMYPKMVKDYFSSSKKRPVLGKIQDAVKMFFVNLSHTLKPTGTFDISEYIKKFLDEYDVIDPEDSNTVPKGLFKSVIDFYAEKYGSPEWDNYTNKEWQVVIPQDIWERVVRGRSKFAEKALPIRVQMKDTGKIVPPYFN